jgi:integrase
MSDARYQALSADRIIATLEKLDARIRDRFPDAGLASVCSELLETAQGCAREAAHLSRPAWGWRAAAATLIISGALAQVASFRFLDIDLGDLSAPELVQGLEAAVNLLILFGGAVWFLLTLEERSKRRRVLGAMHRLRSLAHVIDMHQLTKDPTVVLDARKTPSSPERTMTRFELTRYLDYCSEMLSLIGKLAALYGERISDAVAVEAVNDLENLTTGLGRKIWQKITIIGALQEGRG